jgi:hypothetical protein
MSRLLLYILGLLISVAIMAFGLAGFWREITGESWKASLQVSLLIVSVGIRLIMKKDSP